MATQGAMGRICLGGRPPGPLGKIYLPVAETLGDGRLRIMEHLLTVDGIIALATLFALELVLGIDNIIFISIIAGRLPKKDQNRPKTSPWGLTPEEKAAKKGGGKAPKPTT